MKTLFLFFSLATLLSGCVGVVEGPHRHHYHRHECIVVEPATVVEVR